MSRGLIEAGKAGAAVSRRTFLRFGMTLGAAAGGGLLLGFRVRAAGGDARRSVIGGDAVDEPRPGVFAPNAFVQIDRSGQVTLVMPKVEMGRGEMRSRAGSHPSAGRSGMPQYHDDPNGVEPSLAASANDLGAKLYATYCMHCHGSNGRAFAPLLAPLAGNPAVPEPNPTSMINVILNGAQALVINGLPAAYPMPKFSNVLVRCGEIARGNGPCS